MTTLSLEQLKISTPYTVSQKPWYKEYAFRVTLHGWNLSKSEAEASKVRRLVRKALHTRDIDFRQRRDSNYYVYLKSTSDVSMLWECFAEYIIDIAGPYSESHKDTMLTELNVLLKDTLFYKQYRYKVSFKMVRHDMDFFEEIAEFVTDNFEHGTYKMNSTITTYPSLKEKDKQQLSIRTPAGKNMWYSQGRTHIPYFATGTIYLKNYEDLCTIHMMHKSKISESVKIILTNEVE